MSYMLDFVLRVSMYACMPFAWYTWPKRKVLVTQDDIKRLKAKPVYSKVANRALKQCRWTLLPRNRDGRALDLTKNNFFAWPHYLAAHAEAENIIGTGVVGFGFLRLEDVHDPSMHPRNFVPREDFVAVRADGTAVRLHPHAGFEAAPVYGRLWHWALKMGEPEWFEAPTGPSSVAGPAAEDAAVGWTAFSGEALGQVPRTDSATRADEGRDLLARISDGRPHEYGARVHIRNWKWWRWAASFVDSHGPLIADNEVAVRVDAMCENEEPDTFTADDVWKGWRFVVVLEDGSDRTYVWPKTQGVKRAVIFGARW